MFSRKPAFRVVKCNNFRFFCIVSCDPPFENEAKQKCLGRKNWSVQLRQICQRLCVIKYGNPILR